MGLFGYLRSKEFLRTVILVVAVSLILLFALGKWLNYHTRHDERIAVPSLEKLSLEETERKLSEVNLRYVIIDSASYNPKYPAKSVIEQNPAAGEYVKENRKIYLTLNPSDYKKVSVPNVLDKTKREVVTQLKSVGFRLGEERYIPDLGKDVVRGMEVNGKEIKPGARLPKNTVIDLVLGDGLEEREENQ
jgi:beta-lactam-binding protein with PASTA domain